MLRFLVCYFVFTLFQCQLGTSVPNACVSWSDLFLANLPMKAFHSFYACKNDVRQNKVAKSSLLCLVCVHQTEKKLPFIALHKTLANFLIPPLSSSVRGATESDISESSLAVQPSVKIGTFSPTLFIVDSCHIYSTTRKFYHFWKWCYI